MPVTPEQLVEELPALREQLDAAEKYASRAEWEALSASVRASQAKDKVRVLRDAVASIEAMAAVYFPQDKVRIRPDTGDLRNADVVLTLDDGSTVVVEAKQQPRGRDAVRRVLQDSARPMRPREIVTEVMKRGWVDPDAKNPQSSIRVAARRLVEDGVAEVHEGLYKLSSGTPDDSADASADGQGRLLAEEGGVQ